MGNGSLPSFLHVALDKVLCVLLEHFVDLVQEIVELGLQLLAALGRRGDGGVLLDTLLRGGSLLALLLGPRGYLLGAPSACHAWGSRGVHHVLPGAGARVVPQCGAGHPAPLGARPGAGR